MSVAVVTFWPASYSSRSFQVGWLGAVACALALGTTTKLGIRKRALAATTIWLALRKQKSTITSPEEFFII
jgi:hypothetical protein